MEQMNKKETSFDKLKLLFNLGVVILFILLGFYLLTTDFEQYATLKKGVGLLTIVFFGALGIYGIRRVFKNKDAAK